MKTMRTIFAMLAALCLLSCGKDNNKSLDWDQMIWTNEESGQVAGNLLTVSSAGTELGFLCKNYSSPWIDSADSNGEHFFPPIENNDYRTLTTDWFKAEINGNKLKVVIEANNTEAERSLELVVTAGDIFYTFVFKQSAE